MNQAAFENQNVLVKTQIRIAARAYLMLAIIKKELNPERNLHEILQIISGSMIDKTQLNKLFLDLVCKSRLFRRPQSRIFPNNWIYPTYNRTLIKSDLSE